jgi:hypothetical protein
MAETLIADDLVWELPYAPAMGHPARLSGREEVVRHVTWFVGAVENFRFYDLKKHAFTDPEVAVAEVKVEGLIKPGPHLSPGLCAVPPCGGRQDRVPARWIRRFLVLNPDFQTARSPVDHAFSFHRHKLDASYDNNSIRLRFRRRT